MDKYLHNQDKELEQAYKNAYYKIYDPPVFVSIDSKNPELDAHLEKIKADYHSWVFITAYHPGSKIQSTAFNTSKQAELLSHIRQKGYSYLPGEGGSRDNSWPVEKSVLILNMPLEEALELAGCFEQKAFIHGEKGKKAQLIWSS